MWRRQNAWFYVYVKQVKQHKNCLNLDIYTCFQVRTIRCALGDDAWSKNRNCTGIILGPWRCTFFWGSLSSPSQSDHIKCEETRLVTSSCHLNRAFRKVVLLWKDGRIIRDLSTRWCEMVKSFTGMITLSRGRMRYLVRDAQLYARANTRMNAFRWAFSAPMHLVVPFQEHPCQCRSRWLTFFGSLARRTGLKTTIVGTSGVLREAAHLAQR